ncbi:MAG: SMC-Scp complex subunit ScpB [Rhodospirillales bacterium]|nr:MAG: SMC-Scp complex subunit ScpB [Rhodospirillales bacterium]
MSGVEPLHQRLAEAILFASAEPVPVKSLVDRLPAESDVTAVLAALEAAYRGRGVNLVRIGDAWAFRTAPDLAPLLTEERQVQRRLSRAAMETLAIIAYHQPVTRAEIENIRGVQLSRGTLDSLFELGWIRPKGRRAAPGRPVTWATTTAFLDHFGLAGLDDLPGIDDLKAAGLLDARPAIQVYGNAGETDAPDGD